MEVLVGLSVPPTAVFGYDPKSYRAEISGCRAGLLFLCHAFGYCDAQVHMVHLHIYCDNLGFVQKIGKFRSFPLGPESCCLDAEWDLLISVHGLLSLFPVPPTVEHVKGHQDHTQSYDSLDIVSQMNVDADSLATVELKEYGSILPMVPFDPASQVPYQWANNYRGYPLCNSELPLCPEIACLFLQSLRMVPFDS